MRRWGAIWTAGQKGYLPAFPLSSQQCKHPSSYNDK